MIEVFKGLLGLAKSSPWKLGIILALVTSVIGFIQYQQHIQYKRGYNAAKVEYMEANKKALNKASKAAEKELNKVIAERTHWQTVAIGLQSRPPIKVTEYVTKIIKNNPDCTIVDGFGLLHNSLRETF